jgi:hypothetical protein
MWMGHRLVQYSTTPVLVAEVCPCLAHLYMREVLPADRQFSLCLTQLSSKCTHKGWAGISHTHGTHPLVLQVFRAQQAVVALQDLRSAVQSNDSSLLRAAIKAWEHVMAPQRARGHEYTAARMALHQLQVRTDQRLSQSPERVALVEAMTRVGRPGEGSMRCNDDCQPASMYVLGEGGCDTLHMACILLLDATIPTLHN